MSAAVGSFTLVTTACPGRICNLGPALWTAALRISTLGTAESVLPPTLPIEALSRAKLLFKTAQLTTKPRLFRPSGIAVEVR